MTCKDCTNRHIGCHSECEIYKAFVEENEKLKKIKKEYSQQISDSIKSVERAKRRYK